MSIVILYIVCLIVCLLIGSRSVGSTHVIDNVGTTTISIDEVVLQEETVASNSRSSSSSKGVGDMKKKSTATSKEKRKNNRTTKGPSADKEVDKEKSGWGNSDTDNSHNIHANVIDQNTEMLIYAAANNNMNELKKAIRAGAKVDARDPKGGNNALLFASYNGHIDIVKELLRHGANIEARSIDGAKTALMMASYKNNVDIIKLLIEKGASVDAKNNRGDTVLHIAAYMGYDNLVKLFLEYASIVDHINDQTFSTKYTALHFATFKGHIDIMRLLIQSGGAFMNLLDHQGNNCLMLAILQQHIDVMNMLIDEHIDVIKINHQDNQGNSALHVAVERTCFECMHILILKGQIDMELTNKKGETSLFTAIKIGNVEMVKALLLYGIDSTVTNRSNQTAIEYATSLDFHDVADALRSIDMPPRDESAEAEDVVVYA